MTDIKIVEGGVCDTCGKAFTNDDKGAMICDCPEEVDVG